MNFKLSYDLFGRRIVIALLVYIVTACTYAYADKSDFTSAQKRDPEYDKIYPYYVEICAVSRIRPLDGKEGGGWGHALLYIKGVCLDQESAYPRLRLCGEGEVDLKSPEAGVGVSVDKMFKTVNWMAAPGKQLFYHGNLAEGSRLTRDHFEATISDALSQNLFRGIEFYEEYTTAKPSEQSNDAWVARQTMGTDYAIKFARTSLCARLPVTKDQISQMVDYLNARNEEVFLGKAEFRWSAYYDNCAHTVHNALAAAGIWEEKSINQFRVKQFFNRAIPANEFADFAFLGQTHPGALLKIIPAHEPNDLFGTDYELFVLEGPVRKPITGKVRKMFSNPRHTDLKANLAYFEDRYEKLLARGQNKWRQFFMLKGPIINKSSIKNSLSDIRQKRQALDTLSLS